MDKVYLNIRETSEIVGLPHSTLRYWEKMFPQLSPRKDAHGNRFYSQQDIDLIRQIKYIRDDLKITRIEAIKNELANANQKKDVRFLIAEQITKIKDELLEIKKNL